MSDVKRCAACRKEKPVSEMKTCMRAEMHHYVCDSKCMHDFYSPPKAEKPDYDALLAERYAMEKLCQERFDEIAQLRAELDAIRGQNVSLPEPCLNELYSEQFRCGWNMCLGVMRHKNPRLRKQGWCSTMDRPKAQCGCPDCGSSLVEVNGLPPQQPDAVSVPRELEALKKDAERWRFVREKQTFIWLVQDWIPGDAEFTDVDAAVDSAMQEVALSTRQAEEGE
jgi:hypothetical protein